MSPAASANGANTVLNLPKAQFFIGFLQEIFQGLQLHQTIAVGRIFHTAHHGHFACLAGKLVLMTKSGSKQMTIFRKW